MQLHMPYFMALPQPSFPVCVLKSMQAWSDSKPGCSTVTSKRRLINTGKSKVNFKSAIEIRTNSLVLRVLEMVRLVTMFQTRKKRFTVNGTSPSERRNSDGPNNSRLEQMSLSRNSEVIRLRGRGSRVNV